MQEMMEAYFKEPYRKKKMEDYTLRYEEWNPSCGDGLEVYMKVEDEVVVDYSWYGDTKMISTAAASVIGEYIDGERIEDVMQRNYATMEEWDIVVSEKRKYSAILPLLAIRNAVHRWKEDQIIEDFEDILEETED